MLLKILAAVVRKVEHVAGERVPTARARQLLIHKDTYGRWCVVALVCSCGQSFLVVPAHHYFGKDGGDPKGSASPPSPTVAANQTGPVCVCSFASPILSTDTYFGYLFVGTCK